MSLQFTLPDSKRAERLLRSPNGETKFQHPPYLVYNHDKDGCIRVKNDASIVKFPGTKEVRDALKIGTPNVVCSAVYSILSHLCTSAMTYEQANQVFCTMLPEILAAILGGSARTVSSAWISYIHQISAMLQPPRISQEPAIPGVVSPVTSTSGVLFKAIFANKQHNPLYSIPLASLPAHDMSALAVLLCSLNQAVINTPLLTAHLWTFAAANHISLNYWGKQLSQTHTHSSTVCGELDKGGLDGWGITGTDVPNTSPEDEDSDAEPPSHTTFTLVPGSDELVENGIPEPRPLPVDVNVPLPATSPVESKSSNRYTPSTLASAMASHTLRLSAPDLLFMQLCRYATLLPSHTERASALFTRGPVCSPIHSLSPSFAHPDAVATVATTPEREEPLVTPAGFTSYNALIASYCEFFFSRPALMPHAHSFITQVIDQWLGPYASSAVGPANARVVLTCGETVPALTAASHQGINPTITKKSGLRNVVQSPVNGVAVMGQASSPFREPSSAVCTSLKTMVQTLLSSHSSHTQYLSIPQHPQTALENIVMKGPVVVAQPANTADTSLHIPQAWEGFGGDFDRVAARNIHGLGAMNADQHQPSLTTGTTVQGRPIVLTSSVTHVPFICSPLFVGLTSQPQVHGGKMDVGAILEQNPSNAFDKVSRTLSSSPLSLLRHMASLRSPTQALAQLLPQWFAVLQSPMLQFYRAAVTHWSPRTAAVSLEQLDSVLHSWWMWVQPWAFTPAYSPYTPLIQVSSNQELKHMLPPNTAHPTVVAKPNAHQLSMCYLPWVVGSLPMYTTVALDMVAKLNGLLSSSLNQGPRALSRLMCSYPAGVHVVPNADNTHSTVAAVTLLSSRASLLLDLSTSTSPTSRDVGELTSALLKYLEVFLNMLNSLPHVRAAIRHWERRFCIGVGVAESTTAECVSSHTSLVNDTVKALRRDADDTVPSLYVSTAAETAELSLTPPPCADNGFGFSLITGRHVEGDKHLYDDTTQDPSDPSRVLRDGWVNQCLLDDEETPFFAPMPPTVTPAGCQRIRKVPSATLLKQAETAFIRNHLMASSPDSYTPLLPVLPVTLTSIEAALSGKPSLIKADLAQDLLDSPLLASTVAFAALRKHLVLARHQRLCAISEHRATQLNLTLATPAKSANGVCVGLCGCKSSGGVSQSYTINTPSTCWPVGCSQPGWTATKSVHTLSPLQYVMPSPTHSHPDYVDQDCRLYSNMIDTIDKLYSLPPLNVATIVAEAAPIAEIVPEVKKQVIPSYAERLYAQDPWTVPVLSYEEPVLFEFWRMVNNKIDLLLADPDSTEIPRRVCLRPLASIPATSLLVFVIMLLIFILRSLF